MHLLPSRLSISSSPLFFFVSYHFLYNFFLIFFYLCFISTNLSFLFILQHLPPLLLLIHYSPLVYFFLSYRHFLHFFLHFFYLCFKFTYLHRISFFCCLLSFSHRFVFYSLFLFPFFFSIFLCHSL